MNPILMLILMTFYIFIRSLPTIIINIQKHMQSYSSL